MDYKTLRNKYDQLIYKTYEIIDNNDTLQVKYTYTLKEYTFTPSIYIEKKHIKNKNINKDYLSYLFFNFGLVNIINYFKLSCPK